MRFVPIEDDTEQATLEPKSAGGLNFVPLTADEAVPTDGPGALAGLGRGLIRGGKQGAAQIAAAPSALRLDALAGRLERARTELQALEDAPDASRTDLPVQVTGMPGMRDRRRAQLIKQLQQDESLQRDIVNAFRDYQRQVAAAGEGGIEFTDAVQGKGGFLEWLGQSVGQGAVVMLPLIAAGLTPGVGPALAAGGAVALNRADIVGQRGEDQTLYGAPGLARPAAVEQAMQDPQRLTAKIGAEQGAIGAATAGYSALDFFLGPVGSVIGRGMGRKAAERALADMSKSQIVVDILKETGKQSVEEFINEAGQEGISVLMEAALDGGDIATAENAKRLLNAGAAGAAAGGTMGGGMRAAHAIRAPKEAIDLGRDAARVAGLAGRGADLSQLAAVTDEKGETTYQTPSGDTITKEQWDNAGRRAREAWLKPGEPEAGQIVPRETAAPQQKVVAGVRVDEEIEAAPAPDEVPDEEITAAAPPKSERVQELERLATEAETAEARKELQRQADAQQKKDDDEFRRLGEADDLMRLAKKADSEEVAAGLRARALKLRGVEDKPQEKPAVRGLRVREETVEEVEAQPVRAPAPAEVNKQAKAAAEAQRPEPAGPSRVLKQESEAPELATKRSDSPVLKGLQALGGLKESELADIGIEKKTGVKRKERFVTKKGRVIQRVVDVRDEFRVGGKSLFRKDGRLGMDGVAEWLHERGYLADEADHERAREILRNELAKPGSMKPIAQAEADMISSAERREADQRRAELFDEAAALGIETEGRAPEEVERAVVAALESDWTQRSGLAPADIDAASIVRRAADLDEKATHDAAVRFGDDEAGFLRAAQEIIDANEKREAAGRREVAEPAPGEAAGRRRAGEGQPQAAAADAGRQAAVRGEQRLRVTEGERRAQAGREQPGAERAEAAGPVAPSVTPLAQAQTNLRARFGVPDLTLTPADPGDRKALGRRQAIQNTLAEGIVRDLAKALGLDLKVVWYEQSGGPGIDGFSPSYARDTIFMNVRAKTPAINGIGHEFLHWLKKNHRSDFDYFAKAILPALRNVSEHHRALAQKYERLGAEAPKPETLLEELLADIWADTFSDPQFYRMLAEQDPQGFRSFAQRILQFFDRLLDVVTGKDAGTQQFLSDVRAARKAVADTLAQMRERGAGEFDLETRVRRQQENLSLQELEAAGADPKKLSAHKDAVDAAIKAFLGERAFSWMEQNGLLRPMWSWDDPSPTAGDRAVPAYTQGGRERVILHYDKITPEDLTRIPELLVHEIGTHFGMPRILGEAGFKAMLEQVRAAKVRGDAAFVAAWQKVKRDYIDEAPKPFFAEGSDLFMEEVGAAVVESAPKDSFVRQLIAKVRAWVHQNISPRLAGRMDETLLKGLALAALRKAGRGDLKADAGTTSPEETAARIMMARPGRTPPPAGVATTHASVVHKWLDFFNRHWLDSFSQLKKRQLASVRGQLADALNAYSREQLMHGRASERLKDIGFDYLTPIIKIAGEAELTREDVSDGLYALHAPEANRYIASINPDMQTAGSGMSDKVAGQILASYTPQQRKALDKIDALVQKMNRSKLDRMVDDGLITPAKRSELLARYKHWLSLKQMDDEDTFGLGGPGLSVKGKEFKARMGRYTQAEDPLSMTIRDAMYAVMRAEKNRVAQSFGRFVRAHPNPAAWEEVTAANMPTQRILDPTTNEVRTVPDPFSLYREPQYFGFKEGGEQKWIHVKDPLLAEQMKRLGDHGLDSDNELWHAVINGINTATRLLSRFYTQLSVDFMLANPIRDVQQGLLVATSLDKAKGKELSARMLKDLPVALRDSARANFAEAMGHRPNVALYEQFRQDGGTTGGFGLEDARSIQHQMERAVAALNGDKKAKAALVATAALKPVMALNDSFENMSRFAIYKAALESGFTREQAAVMAKNVTVNFNKRGMASPLANALWAFFNASMQANVAAVRAVVRSRVAQTASLALFAAGAFAALGDDEDERGIDESERVSEFVLDRNLVFPFGEKGAVKIPLAYGFNIPYATGRHLVRALQGKESVGHMLGAILKLGFTTFLPTDSLVPTVAQPMIDVATGTDFAGRRIAKEDPFDYVTPKSSQYNENANAAAVAFFKALNAASGGTEFTKGAVDVSPEKATYLVKQYLGGLAAPLEIAALPFAEKATVADVPVVRRFASEAKEDIYITKAGRIIREAEARRKAIEGGQAEAKPGEEEFVQTVRAYESSLRRLAAARNRMLKENKKADVSEIDEQRNLLADQVLTARKAYQQQEAR